MSSAKALLEENPIRKKLRRILQSGQTTEERICVALDLKYLTFMNIFKRDRVSRFVMQALFHAKVITIRDKDAYIAWEEKYLALHKRSRRVYRPVPSVAKPFVMEEIMTLDEIKHASQEELLGFEDDQGSDAPESA